MAAVALARKVLCILHHLLTNNEMYQEEGIQKKIKIDFDKTNPSDKMSLGQMIQLIARAGYEVKRIEMGEG